MLKNYLKIALRNLRKRPFYTGINILGLAVGMACTMLITVYIYQELSYDRFHENAGRIHRIATHVKIGDTEFTGAAASPALGPTMVKEIPEVEMAVRIDRVYNTIVKREDLAFNENKLLAAGPDFFEIFSFPLTQGNPSTVLDKPNTVVLSQEAAQRYFSLEDPIGQQLQINDQLFQVSGVMKDVPGNSHMQFDIVYSLMTDPMYNSDDWGDIRVATYYRIQENADPKLVEARANELLASYFGEYELFQELGYMVEFITQPMLGIHLHSKLRGEFGPNGDIKYLYIFGAIALFILLIACINFMNLATARSADRAKEVGIRKTMGSVRSRLIIQFLGESIILSFLATLLALGLAELLRVPFGDFTGRTILLPLLEWWFLPTILLFSLFVGLLAGSYPAFYLTRFRPSEVLKGEISRGQKNVVFRNTLVVLQFAISIILIVCTLMVYQQLQYVRNKDLGFNKENVLVIENSSELGDSKEAFENTLRALSQVQDISFTSVAPLTGTDGSVFTPATFVDSLGGEDYLDENAQVLNSIRVSYDYLPTMGIPITTGRNFSREVAADSNNYALIINEQAARTLGLSDPVGSKVMYASEFEATVVGVTEDFHYQSLHSAVEPLVMVLSEAHNFTEVRLLSDDLPGTLAEIDRHWKEHSGGLPFNYSFLDEDFDALFRSDQQMGLLFGTFAAIAILIACLGLLALATFMAEQRTKEVGVRKVLGASVGHIIVLLTKDFTKLVLIAFVLAAPLAYYAIQLWLREFAYRIDPNVMTFLVAGILALLVAVITVSWQSYKAAVANPVKSLRNE